MSRRHLPLPRVWMLTDERQGAALWPAMKGVPRGAGVIVRHYSLPEREREALARMIVRLGLFVAYAGDEGGARRSGARAVYGQSDKRGRLPRLFPVHDAAEIVRAGRAGAAAVLVSPVFATRSHPGARALGPLRFGLLAKRTGLPVIALGGMTPSRFRRLRRLGASGWAAIDAWIRT